MFLGGVGFHPQVNIAVRLSAQITKGVESAFAAVIRGYLGSEFAYCGWDNVVAQGKEPTLRYPKGGETLINLIRRQDGTAFSLRREFWCPVAR